MSKYLGYQGTAILNIKKTNKMQAKISAPNGKRWFSKNRTMRIHVKKAEIRYSLENVSKQTLSCNSILLILFSSSSLSVYVCTAISNKLLKFLAKSSLKIRLALVVVVCIDFLSIKLSLSFNHQS